MAGWCEWQQYICNCPNLLAKSIFCPNRFGVEVRNIIIPTMLCFTMGEFARTVSLVWRYNYSPHVVSHRGRTCPTTCCVLPVVGVEVQFLPKPHVVSYQWLVWRCFGCAAAIQVVASRSGVSRYPGCDLTATNWVSDRLWVLVL